MYDSLSIFVALPHIGSDNEPQSDVECASPEEDELDSFPGPSTRQYTDSKPRLVTMTYWNTARQL